jgi:hypothetical protein
MPKTLEIKIPKGFFILESALGRCFQRKSQIFNHSRGISTAVKLRDEVCLAQLHGNLP